MRAPHAAHGSRQFAVRAPHATHGSRLAPHLLAALTIFSIPATAQRPASQRAAAQRPAVTVQPSSGYDTTLFAALRWREIGPFRGGRSTASAGSMARPYEYYMGTTGGGVFKTTDGGITWIPVTDKFFGGTTGSIAVAESNPDIVYVGGGEGPIRGNVSHGEGVWKSEDAGKTWTNLGLKEARQIPSLLVHPTNPDIVYVGAQGPFWGPNPDRGVFKSTDGGKTWRKVLFRSDSAGVADMVMDPKDPNTLYATLWQSYRTAWKMSSGGAGSGIFKSTDGGENWTELTRNPGLPTGLLGKIGITVSGANSNRLWALVEADNGGVFRSEDGGKSWAKTNDERKLRQRAWYYTHVHADPKDSNTVYALNTGFYKSTDGGRTFRPIPVPHGDNHHLWIAHDNPQRMINCNDGGCNVSFNGGRSWTEQDVATAQMYQVATSNDFPYQVCGSQQDNSTICIPSRAPGGISMDQWYIGPGCESGYFAIRPDKPDISFAGCYGGQLDRKDRQTGFQKAISPWPDNPMGYSSEDIKYRVQWTFPIVISPHDPNVMYVGSNVIFKSTNEGQSFEVISPDLTRHDPKTMGPSGGPLTKDQTGVETYATIFTIAESPKARGVIWTGSDDGLVQISRDNAKTWQNVTPKDMGDFSRISLIEASPHDAATAYVAAHRHQFGDLRPTMWKTSDYGRTWTRIDRGIAQDEPVRTVREDPERKGLLYAGTERGVWVSFDDGANWQSLKLNLPPVPVHAMVVKEGDLVLGTHGRSFWILDDLSALRQMSREIAAKVHLFKPRDTHRVSWGGGFGGGGGAHPSGRNPTSGAVFYYTLARAQPEVKFDILDDKGALIRSFTSKIDSLGLADSVRADSVKKALADSLRAVGQRPVTPPTPLEPMTEEQQDFEELARRGPRPARVPNKAGLNTFAWDMRYPDASRFYNMIMWSAGTTGPMALPGTYTVRLTAGRNTQTQTFKILADPRAKASREEMVAQFDLLMKIRDKTTEANDAVRTVRNVKAQLTDREGRATGAASGKLAEVAKPFTERISAIEGEIYQVKNQSSQDPLNYPIKLNNRIAALAGVVGSGHGAPTEQSFVVFNELSAQLDTQLGKLKEELTTGLVKVNAVLREAGLPVIVPSTTEIAPRREMVS